VTVENSHPVIAIIGVCASGKSTIIQRLSQEGIICRHVAQEHSYVKDMWQRLTHPDYLICLEVSYPSTLIRKKLNWTLQEYVEQLHRTQHAREHADLTIDTDQHNVDEIVELIKQGLISAGLVTPAIGGNEAG